MRRALWFSRGGGAVSYERFTPEGLRYSRVGCGARPAVWLFSLSAKRSAPAATSCTAAAVDPAGSRGYRGTSLIKNRAPLVERQEVGACGD